MRKRYHELFGKSLLDWLYYHQRQVVLHDCRWMGVQTQKNPLDAWIYQEILHEVRPDVVVEIGSAAGGSTLYLAHLLDLIGNGSVISVDIDRSRYVVEHERISTVTGDSTSPEIVQQVHDLCGARSALVIDDGDHGKEAVLSNLRSYSPLVAVGSYFLVEDGIMDLFMPGEDGDGQFEGPLAAVEQFLEENEQFEVDSSRERYLITYNPRGFLKRVR